jgi:nitrogen-specific signal transduction histidine kinase
VGLGLALAHQVATQHQGKLAWTRADGQTQFRLTLPLAMQTAKEAG